MKVTSGVPFRVGLPRINNRLRRSLQLFHVPLRLNNASTLQVLHVLRLAPLTAILPAEAVRANAHIAMVGVDDPSVLATHTGRGATGGAVVVLVHAGDVQEDGAVVVAHGVLVAVVVGHHLNHFSVWAI